MTVPPTNSSLRDNMLFPKLVLAVVTAVLPSSVLAAIDTLAPYSGIYHATSASVFPLTFTTSPRPTTACVDSCLQSKLSLIPLKGAIFLSPSVLVWLERCSRRTSSATGSSECVLQGKSYSPIINISWQSYDLVYLGYSSTVRLKPVLAYATLTSSPRALATSPSTYRSHRRTFTQATRHTHLPLLLPRATGCVFLAVFVLIHSKSLIGHCTPLRLSTLQFSTPNALTSQ